MGLFWLNPFSVFWVTVDFSTFFQYMSLWVQKYQFTGPKNLLTNAVFLLICPMDGNFGKSWRFLSANILTLYTLKLTVRPWKWMVGRLLSFWDGLFSEVFAVSFRECKQKPPSTSSYFSRNMTRTTMASWISGSFERCYEHRGWPKNWAFWESDLMKLRVCVLEENGEWPVHLGGWGNAVLEGYFFTTLVIIGMSLSIKAFWKLLNWCSPIAIDL